MCSGAGAGAGAWNRSRCCLKTGRLRIPCAVDIVSVGYVGYSADYLLDMTMTMYRVRCSYSNIGIMGTFVYSVLSVVDKQTVQNSL